MRVIFPLFRLTEFLLVSIQKAQSVLDKIPMHGIFKLLSVNFSKYVHCDKRFLVEKISVLLCFLDHVGIAVLTFSH